MLLPFYSSTHRRTSRRLRMRMSRPIFYPFRISTLSHCRNFYRIPLQYQYKTVNGTVIGGSRRFTRMNADTPI